MNCTTFLRTRGYDPFFDFMKGICILCVIWLHCMPFGEYTLAVFWASQAVPLFLFMQVFHALKGGKRPKFPSLKKLFKRIVFPFLMAITFVALFKVINHKHLAYSLLFKTGPGSYYPYVYIQFAFLIPILVWVAKKLNTSLKPTLIIITLFFSIISEILASVFGLSTTEWKFLCVRYIFIIGLATYWARGKVTLNIWTFILSLISIFFIWLFRYKGFKWEPWFYDTSWNQCHWLCYFYPAFLVVTLLAKLYECSKKWLKKAMIILGKASYEIFLMQMSVISVLKLYLDPRQNAVLFIPSVWLLSIVLGLSFRKLLTKTNQ